MGTCVLGVPSFWFALSFFSSELFVFAAQFLEFKIKISVQSRSNAVISDLAAVSGPRLVCLDRKAVTTRINQGINDKINASLINIDGVQTKVNSDKVIGDQAAENGDGFRPAIVDMNGADSFLDDHHVDSVFLQRIEV